MTTTAAAPVHRPFGARPGDGLTWWPELGLGFHPIRSNGAIYDADYFQNYVRLAATEMGKRITAARVALVQRYRPLARALDIGIGAGAFVERRNGITQTPHDRQPMTYGFDINPHGVAWLQERELFRDPHQPIEAMTFWDSLEHIQDPEPMLANATWVFITLPVFTGPDHVLRSKHFKRDEHCWYFTRDGLIGWMQARGFVCLEHNTMESLLGREDSGTFVFQREDQKAHGPEWGSAR